LKNERFYDQKEKNVTVSASAILVRLNEAN
jgi:hypothetical protein